MEIDSDSEIDNEIDNEIDIVMITSKIHPLAMGLSLGFVVGLAAFTMGLFANTFLNGQPLVAGIGAMYLSYTPSMMGCVFAGIGGFVGAFVGTYIVIWLYNQLLDRV